MKLLEIKAYRVIFICLCLLSFYQIKAQKIGDLVWHAGIVVLNNSDTIKGQIKYSFPNNSIEFKKGNDYRRLLPGKFVRVEFVSSIDNKPHVFEVFKIQTTSHDINTTPYYRPYFFEAEDTTGKIKLYKQYYWTKRTNSFSSTGTFNTVASIYFNFYYVNKDGIATYIKPKRRKILRLLRDKKSQVKTKAKFKNWSYNTPYGIVQIIQYFNSLF